MQKYVQEMKWKMCQQTPDQEEPLITERLHFPEIPDSGDFLEKAY